MNNFFSGFEPDFDVRQELRFVGGVLDLRQFDKILVSVSGGKDSHAMLFLVKELADRHGVSDRMIAVYADTGMEWHNAEAHVRTICAAAGVQVEVVYPVRPMLKKFEFRFNQIKGRIQKCGFPSQKCRWCTSEQKVAPMDKFMRQFTGKLLKVTGERWGESNDRSKYHEYVFVPRISTAKRMIYGWRPMLSYTKDDVWSMVRDTGVPRHVCYDMGCDRLGCAECIFSSDLDLRIEMRENPETFEALDRLEVDSGYIMSMSGKRIRDRIKK